MKSVVMTFGADFCSRIGPRIEFDNPSPYGVITAPGRVLASPLVPGFSLSDVRLQDQQKSPRKSLGG